jgi:2-desacetyl-2-hydroxyethyl bacteriochlorophyllide A dehydrogenase
VTDLPASTRALAYERYGGPEVLALREVPIAPPRGDEVLVRVRAAALNPKDSLVRKGRFRALSGRAFPKRVGVDVAGEVLAVGPRARGFAPGDRVFGAMEEVTYRRGTLAEHATLRAHELAPMPPSLSFEQAAALPLAALTALQALRDLARVGPGDAVLVHGASGGVGTVALQIARALGARVTSTSSAANLELCRAHGAHEALDYRVDAALDARDRYRAIFDVFGNLRFADARRALADGGTFVSTVPSARLVADVARSLLSRRRARLVVVRSRRADLDVLRALVERGQLAPVVDRVVDLERAVDGVRHLETKRARGKIVVAVP